MKPIQISFNKGIQFPPKLGTLILKPAEAGKAGYAQNIDISNDEYGNGAVTPGPVLTTIGNNSNLTGVPMLRQYYSVSATPDSKLWFAQGVLGTQTVLRRIKDILSGSTPTIDTTGSMTASHSGHSNVVITDMVARPQGGNDFIYVAIKDATDVTVSSFRADLSSPSLSSPVAIVSPWTGGYTNAILVFSTFDYKIYLIGQNRVDSIDTSDVQTVNALALGLPTGSYATAAADWQQQLVIASVTSPLGDFSQRQQGGKSIIILWDYFSPAIIRNIPTPFRYISALIPAPDGQLLVFGGVDEGKSSIASFNGYGISLLTQYIGDLPRSRHSVEFDSQGRICFQTVDGQFCRFDKSTGIFEHLGSLTTGSSAGGLLARGIGSPAGNEFFVASGTGSTYTLKKVQFGSFIGDGADSDTINTPLIVSGIQVLPQGSVIQAITLNLTKSLEAGEKVELRIYANGSTTPTTYLTMSFADDGAVSSKREVLTLLDINSFNVGVVWKQADGLTTSPPVLSADVEVENTH